MFDWYRILPWFWFQNTPTCKEWDTILNKLLDKHGITDCGDYLVSIGPHFVWVENWPYAYGSLCDKRTKVFTEPLPSVKTRLRLRKMIKEFKEKKYKEKFDV